MRWEKLVKAFLGPNANAKEAIRGEGGDIIASTGIITRFSGKYFCLFFESLRAQ